MPIPNYDQYCQILDNALAEGYALPAINVTSTSTANAALKAFKELGSDGIIQVSVGGGKFASGGVGSTVLGSISLAQHVHIMAKEYDVFVALHTDHCHPEHLEGFMVPLLEESEKRVERGEQPLFNSHMFDGSPLPLKENLKTSLELHKRCRQIGIVLEIETGIVGGEEDGVNNEDAPAEKLYTTPEDMVEVARTLRPIGKFMYAATFGNVHGVYKPGNVKLRPDILKVGQEAVVAELGEEARHWLVFHGGSGSELSEIHETLNFGVIKMNVDTDTQYAYTRACADHMFSHYDKVLKVEGEVGSKKYYDPRAWMKKAEESMSERICQAIVDLKSEGKTLYRS